MKGFAWTRSPWPLLSRWRADAAKKIGDGAEAMSLATATRRGIPSARMVLLKGADQDGLRFFSNVSSRKGLELTENPRAAVVLYWAPLGRQIRAEGRVVPVSRAEAAAYFASRPLGSRLSALVSPQSREISTAPGWGGRALLARAAVLAGARYGDDVPCPEPWTGWRLKPEAIEFWQSGDHRLHYRLRFTRSRGVWRRAELAP